MKTIKSETKFEANDGRKFTDPKAAERYEAVLEAKRAYQAACQALTEAAAECCLTADGKSFRFDVWRGYWSITPGWFAMPQLRRIDFSWVSHWCLKEIPPDNDGTTVVLVDLGKNDERTRGQEFPVNELYLDEHAARVALIARQEAWLAEQAAEVGKSKAKL